MQRLHNGNPVSVLSVLHYDGLGSVRAVTNAPGLKSETSSYHPYGEQSEGVWTALLNETKGYIGERYDADAGLQYLNARYYDPRLGMFVQPDWWEVTIPGVGTNRYSYSFNDPVNGRDPTGHECGGINMFGGFCDRAFVYYDLQIELSARTNFFGAASLTSRMLANIDEIELSFMSVSGETRGFLRTVGAALEPLNMKMTSAVRSGLLSGSNLDYRLVHMEQSAVQQQLEKLKNTKPQVYERVLREINGLLNAKDGFSRWAGGLLGADGDYQDVLDRVREKLGHDIDFESQKDREAIGRELVDELERIKKGRPEGWSGCDAAGCSWNDKSKTESEVKP
ncbi:MAG: RHS repeat-associated core domain-containing protein [Paracoccaceae bacterium]